jgi:hypothetical protein
MPTENYDADQDDLRSLTEKIQVGDTEEGAQALGEIINRARASVDRNSIRQMMQEEAAEMKLRAENTKALEKFAAKYPTLKDDHLLVDAAQRVLRDRIVDDLKGAGATDDDLAPLRDDTGRLVAAHSQARLRGVKLQSPDELLNATGAVLTERFNIRPARRSGTEYVREMRRDRGFAADGSGQAGAQASAVPDDRTASYVQRLRTARGFPARR